MYEYFYGMYASDDPEDVLEHHGILGMKWGIRRFQNYDGSLKAEGRKRRAEERVQKRAERKAAKAEKKAAKEEEARKKLRAEIDDAIANVDFEKLSKYKGQMTDADLKRIADRAQDLGRTARQLNDYKKGLPSSAFEKAVNTLHAVSKGLDAIRGAHASYTDLKKEFGIDRKSLMESLKDDSDSGSKSGSDEPDIFDRVAELTKSIAKDAASKANEKYQERKFQKDLQKARDEKANLAILDFMDNIDKSGSNSPRPTNSDVDVPKPTLPWATKPLSQRDLNGNKEAGSSISDFMKGIDNTGSKERGGKSNADVPPVSLPWSTPAKSVPKPTPQTQKTVDRILKTSSADSISIDDLNSDLLRRNGQKLGL